MTNFDESAIIKKHVRSINFLENTSLKSAKTPSFPRTPDNTEGDTNSASVSCHADSDKIDSIRSCESVIKIFKFETGPFNKNNEKCLAFWNAINSRGDIKPVNCIIMDAQENKRTSECQTEQKESEASLWARALYELRKRKLDKVALAATTDTCNFCKTLNYRFASAPDPKDLLDDQDLSELDNWNPKTSNKTTQFTNKEISRDCGTSVQSGYNVACQINEKTSQEEVKVTQVEQLINVSELQQCNENSLHSEGSVLNPIYPGPEQNTSMDSKNLESDSTKGACDTIPKCNSHSEFGLLDPETFGESPVDNTDSESFEKRSSPKTSVAKNRENNYSVERKRVSISGHIRSKSNVKSSAGSHSTTAAQDKDKDKDKEKQPLPESKSISFRTIAVNEKRRTSSSDVDSNRLVSEPFKNGSSPKLPRRPSLKVAPKLQSSTRDLQKVNSTGKVDAAKGRVSTSTPALSKSLDAKPSKDPIKFNVNTLTSADSLEAKRSKQLRSFSKVSDVIPRKQISFFEEAGSTPSEIIGNKTPLEQSEVTMSTLTPREGSFQESQFNQTMIKQMPTVNLLDSKPNLIMPILPGKVDGIEVSSIEKQGTKLSKADTSQSTEFSNESGPLGLEVNNLLNRDESTDAQHLTSLLHFDTLKQLDKIAEKKRVLEDELRKVHALESKEELDRIYLCPCLNTLNKTTCFQCTCKQGVCLKPDENDLERMEQVFDHLPPAQKPRMKCFLKILCKIRQIMKLNLGQEETDAKIIKILTGLGPCECEGGPCECQLHHLDLATMKDNVDYMAATLLDEFNKVLDEKLQSKLGIALEKKRDTRNKRLSTEDLPSFKDDTPKMVACNVCQNQICMCRTK